MILLYFQAPRVWFRALSRQGSTGFIGQFTLPHLGRVAIELFPVGVLLCLLRQGVAAQVEIESKP
jgi:hypothetical protein